MADARSELERKNIKRFYALLAGSVVFSIALLFVAIWAKPLALTHPGLYAALAVIVTLSWLPTAAHLVLSLSRGMAAHDHVENPLEFEAEAANPRLAFEYCSRISLMGLPLVRIRLGGPRAARYKPVKAWIAVGDVAFGGLFAMGGIAVAPVAFGGIAIGGVLFGGFGVGILAYAGFALGVWTMGGMVAGLEAIGGCAVAWKAAVGGIAVAHEFAQGGVALATHANDAVVQAYVGNNGFFRYAYLLMTKWLWPTMILATLPSLVIWQLARRKRRQ
jgi:hypothetical protein